MFLYAELICDSVCADGSFDSTDVGFEKALVVWIHEFNEGLDSVYKRVAQLVVGPVIIAELTKGAFNIG